MIYNNGIPSIQQKKSKTPLAFLLIASLSLGTSQAHAQGLLNKLVEKVQQSTKSGGGLSNSDLSAADRKLLEEDKADASLDKISFANDKRGISGIYYANVPVGGISLNQARTFAVGKFLIEYDDNTGVATISTRFGFEANDPSRLLPKAKFSRTSTYKDRNLRALQNTTHFLLPEGNAESRQHYVYGQMIHKTDLQGNKVPDKLVPKGLECLLELEPGILYVGDRPFASSGGSADGHNLLLPGVVLPLLIKPGMEEAAKAWTTEKIIKRYRAANAAFDSALEDTAANADPNLALREPSNVLPTKAENEAAIAQWNSLIKSQAVGGTQSKRSFKLVYVYPATAFETQSKKQYVNNSYVDTIISRSRVYVAVFQDQDSKYWTNRFYLVEKPAAGSFFGERWSGQYEYALPASALPVAIEKSQALKYQATAKTK